MRLGGGSGGEYSLVAQPVISLRSLSPGPDLTRSYPDSYLEPPSPILDLAQLSQLSHVYFDCIMSFVVIIPIKIPMLHHDAIFDVSLCVYPRHVKDIVLDLKFHSCKQGGRTWSLSSGAKMALKIFVKSVFTIFASNASFLRVIANLQN